MKITYKCMACQESFDSFNMLYSHTKKIHNLNGKQYYDKYLKKPDEGKCLTCGKDTKLWNNTLGYYMFCSKECKSINLKQRPRTGKRILTQQDIKISGKFVCEICGNHTNGLGSHIVQVHNISSKEYYDTYLRKPDEGICPVCGKETSFRGIMKGGYLKHCSVKCLQNNPETIKKKKETSRRLHGVDNWRNPDKARQTLAKHLAKGSVVKQEYIQSAAETELIDFIKTFYEKTHIHGDRTVLDGYELDIWLPDINVGIEYDGEFWHADSNRFKPDDIVINNLTAQDIWNKDKRKDLLAESKGIHLYRIKEHDYKENKSECLTNLYKYIKQFMEI